MVPATMSLTGFSGETIWPLGQLRLLVTIGDAKHYTKSWMNFMIVRSPSPYNGIIGRPGIREIQAVPSTAHGMLKFSLNGKIVTIRNTIMTPAECITITSTPKDHAKKAEARHKNFKVAIHHDFPEQENTIRGTVSIKARTKLCTLLKRNLDIFAWQPSDMTGDCYPLPDIDWKVKSLCGYPFKCFLDAYKGYHQIQMAKQDEKKTAFHTGHGVYCYTKRPFGLKNVGATYQRLVDQAFDKQIGHNHEIYVDDLVIKSHTETELLQDIEETFRTLRKINMKLNPKKCTFGAAEGMFLGYMINPEGIKPCPDKTEVVLQLLSPRTIKEVQSLNGKLASLNRFISKLAEKSLPLFKTLKKCIKKSDFHWTLDAEQAFKQLKQHLAKLPMLVAPKPKEELIMYLSASYGAISAVLMTEKDTEWYNWVSKVESALEYVKTWAPAIKNICDIKRKNKASNATMKKLCKIVIEKKDPVVASKVFGSAIAKAVKYGIYELIEECILAYPGIIWSEFEGYNLFHLAIKERQVQVYNLVYQMSGHKAFAANELHGEENALHIAAKLAPSHRLSTITGAALQMQRELQWYKEVENFVEPQHVNALNKDLKTPWMVFTDEHKDLLKEGQQWMKDTATSCTVVAALIVTITFAAAITVPGGNKDDGKPVFLDERAFMLFMISDAFALFSSSTSLLMFLGILTSRYAEEDFLYSLPKRLTIGLVSLMLERKIDGISLHKKIMDVDILNGRMRSLLETQVLFRDRQHLQILLRVQVLLQDPLELHLVLKTQKCSNCKLLTMKIKILEARLAMKKNPDDHPYEPTTILHELLNEMENLRVE
nr:reverse transcriptase domain-containing protein [Tanacetum cinerariifolium]